MSDPTSLRATGGLLLEQPDVVKECCMGLLHVAAKEP